MNDFFDDLHDKLDDEAELLRVPPMTLRNTVACTDDSLMTFGKYKGLQVKDVPASYLLWYADQDKPNDVQLLAYVCKNRKALEEEKEAIGGREYGEDYERWYYDRND